MENFKRIDSHWINPESPWNMIRGKYLFENPKILNKDSKENNLLSLTLNGVLNKDMESGGGLRPDSYETYQIFYKNDLVFKLIDLENVKTSRVGWVHERGLMSPVYIRLKPKDEKINTRYFYYYFFDLYQRHIFNSIGSGIRSSLSGTNLLELLVPNPSHEEQNQIVDFLDKKINQINELIKKIEQKITLLKEQRTSLMNEVVTKGLNPNIEMKNTDIDWIGEIPRHWELLRLNNLGRFSKGKGITKDKIKENGNKSIMCSEIYTTYQLRFNETKSFIDDETTDESILCSKGVLLFTGDGESLEEIGKCVVYEGDEELYVGGGINVFTPKQEKVIPIYLSYVMNSDSVIYQKSRQGRGEIVVHIYSKQLKEIRLGLPPIKEQQKIVEFLDEETQKIDKTIYKEEKRIELLKEYKQSLISEVVTGKKRVV